MIDRTLRFRIVAAMVFCGNLACRESVDRSTFPENERWAMIALEELHERFNAGNFDAIYDNASEELRAEPREKLLASLGGARETWGKFIKAGLRVSQCFPDTVHLQIQAEFEKGEALELVEWHIPDKTALLAHFEVVRGNAGSSVASPNGCETLPQ